MSNTKEKNFYHEGHKGHEGEENEFGLYFSFVPFVPLVGDLFSSFGRASWAR
jgi:hypothetical protein